VYLAHLLQAFGDPEYLESSQPYLHRYDHEVFGRLSSSTDSRLKYRIYKTNADFLLVSIGVFDNPSQTLLAHMPGQRAGSRRKQFEPTEEATISRGRTYYRFAYSYSQLVNRRQPAVSDVLQKLAVGFDRYTRILAHLRGEYLDIIHELTRGEVYHLERSVNREQEREQLRALQDAFLDAYAAWRRDRSSENEASLRQAVGAVRQFNPGFSFDLERSKEAAGGDDTKASGDTHQD
jgi:hypothetical protein